MIIKIILLLLISNCTFATEESFPPSKAEGGPATEGEVVSEEDEEGEVVSEEEEVVSEGEVVSEEDEEGEVVSEEDSEEETLDKGESEEEASGKENPEENNPEREPQQTDAPSDETDTPSHSPPSQEPDESVPAQIDAPKETQRHPTQQDFFGEGKHPPAPSSQEPDESVPAQIDAPKETQRHPTQQDFPGEGKHPPVQEQRSPTQQDFLWEGKQQQRFSETEQRSAYSTAPQEQGEALLQKQNHHPNISLSEPSRTTTEPESSERVLRNNPDSLTQKIQRKTLSQPVSHPEQAAQQDRQHQVSQNRAHTAPAKRPPSDFTFSVRSSESRFVTQNPEPRPFSTPPVTQSSESRPVTQRPESRPVTQRPEFRPFLDTDTPKLLIPPVIGSTSPAAVVLPPIETLYKSNFTEGLSDSNGWTFTDTPRANDVIPTHYIPSLEIGRFAGLFSGQDCITKSITLPNSAKFLELQFDFLRVDRWKDQKFKIRINDEVCVSQSYNSALPDRIQSYGVPLAEYSFLGLGDTNSNSHWAWHNDQLFRFLLFFEVSNNQVEFLGADGIGTGTRFNLTNGMLKVDFSSDLPTSLNGQWGVDNITLRNAAALRQFNPPTRTLPSEARSYYTSIFAEGNSAGWTVVEGARVGQDVPVNFAEAVGWFAQPAQTDKMTRTIPLNDDVQNHLQLSFDFLRTDEWSDDTFQVLINDVLFVSQTYSSTDPNRTTLYGTAGTQQAIVGLGEDTGTVRATHDQIHHFNLLLKKNGTIIELFNSFSGRRTSINCPVTLSNSVLNITFAVNNSSTIQRKWGIANVNLYSAEHNSGSLQLPMTYPVTTYDAPLSTTHHKSQFAENESSGWIMALGSRKDENVPVNFSEHARVGWFAGPFQTDKITQTISLASLAADNRYCQLLFDFLRIDEWHDNTFHLAINGVAFVTQAYSSEDPDDSHVAYSVASVQQVIQGLGDSQGYWLAKYDQIHHFNLLFEFDDGYLELLNSRGEKVGTRCLLTSDQFEGNGLKIDFAADTGPTQKSWGISNVLLRSAEHPAFFDPRFNFVTLSASDSSTIVLSSENTLGNWQINSRSWFFTPYQSNERSRWVRGNAKIEQTFTYTKLGVYFQLLLNSFLGLYWDNAALTLKINDIEMFSQTYSSGTVADQYQVYGREVEGFSYDTRVTFDLRAIIIQEDEQNSTLSFFDPNHQHLSGTKITVPTAAGSFKVALEAHGDGRQYFGVGTTHVRSVEEFGNIPF